MTASTDASASGGGRIDAVSLVELDAKGAIIREIPVTAAPETFGSVPLTISGRITPALPGSASPESAK